MKHTARATYIAAAVICTSFLAPRVVADEAIEIVVKRNAKTVWQVEQTLELSSKSKGKTGE